MQNNEVTEDQQEQPKRLRAVEYVRMSTEHQQYSTENQADKIREYAAHRNIDIVRTYADAGKSGLRIDGRQALQQLIKDVESGSADFSIRRICPEGSMKRSPVLPLRRFPIGLGTPRRREPCSRPSPW